MNLNNELLLEVKGGATSWYSIGSLILGGLSFIIGVVDGFINTTKKCTK